MANSHIKAELIEISEFPRVSERYRIRAVPTTVIDDRVMFMGALPEKDFVEQVLKAADSNLAGPSSTVGGVTSPAQPPGASDPRTGGSGRIIIP